MLIRLIKQLFFSDKIKKDNLKDIILLEAENLLNSGYTRDALNKYLSVLKIDSVNIIALNCIAVCYADLGDINKAKFYFDLAYSLDDTFLPVIVNSAKFLVENNQIESALNSLKKAKIVDPSFSHTDTVFAAVCLKQGDSLRAREVQLQPWMANFDNLRLADCFLFNSAYCDLSERLLAAEHFFWAETLKKEQFSLINKNKSNKKIKIGYWSPDLRNHSVRYFFKPLLINQNKELFEVHLYHDHFTQDEHTADFKKNTDFFHDIYELTNRELIEKIIGDQLDVLVELAGHTSANRINLLKNKLASIQITGLGYPPTTGLSTIDYKILDKHISTENDRIFYSEKGLILPESFWCFDPMEEAPLAEVPPVINNKYITFACVGNIAKINEKTLQQWKKIIKRIPKSRLLIRSISFNDESVVSEFKEKIRAAQLPLDRIDIRLPEGGINFFTSYNEIDVILDTYPFNGGTTTCFAVYMGVPVVTMAGQSLISRMGLSILRNVNAAHLIAENEDEYIEKAIKISQDIKFLKKFKATARKIMQSNALGNGEIFTAHFENALLNAIQGKTSTKEINNIDILSAEEIVKRAYMTLRFNQNDACQRIIDFCLKYYPSYGNAHIAHANLQSVLTSDYAAQIDYLKEKISTFSDGDKISALITIIRWSLLINNPIEAEKFLQQLLLFKIIDPIDVSYKKLYQSYLIKNYHSENQFNTISVSKNIAIIISVQDSLSFERIKSNFSKTVRISNSSKVEFFHSEFKNKSQVFTKVIKSEHFDTVLFLHGHVSIQEPMFLYYVLSDLEEADLVGFAGATEWSKLDWNTDNINKRHGIYYTQSLEKQDKYDFISIGILDEKFKKSNIQLLDGSFIAANRKYVQNISFDPQLNGVENLMEQYWSYCCALQKKKLIVDLRLGIFLDKTLSQDSSYLIDAKEYIVELLKFDMSSFYKEQLVYLSLPIASLDEATILNQNLFSSSL